MRERSVDKEAELDELRYIAIDGGRRNCKIRKEEDQYMKLKHLIQKQCREAKDKYYEDKCKEIEMLDKVHSQLLYQKIKELRPKGNRMVQLIKSKQGKNLTEKEEVMERWAEYVEDLYKDENRGKADKEELVNGGCIQSVMKR